MAPIRVPTLENPSPWHLRIHSFTKQIVTSMYEESLT